MALLWMDGFEGLGTTGTVQGIAYRYPGASTSNLNVGPGRLTGYGLDAVSTNPTGYTPALTQDPTLIVGCAFLSKNTTDYSQLMLYDNATSGINITITASVPSTIITKRGSTVLDTTTLATTLMTYTWYYFELKVFCHNTSGTVEVRIDGETVVSLIGIDTRSGVDDFYNRVRWVLQNGYMDDYYICDGTGDTFNDFVGTCKILAVFPNADTATEEWTPSTAGTHYIRIDENPPSTTDYVGTATQNAIDLYSYPSLIGNSTILAIQVTTLVSCISGMTILFEAPVVSNGVTELGPDFQLTSATYQEVSHISTTDPNTGEPWIIAGLTAAQIGMRAM